MSNNQHRSSNSNDVTASDVFFMFESNSYEEKIEMGKNIIDSHVRDQMHANNFNYIVQDGLEYDLDVDELVDDFIAGIEAVDVYTRDDLFGVVCVDLISSTIDTGQLINVPDEPPYDTEPSFAKSNFVKCSLKTYSRFSANGIMIDVAVSVRKHPMHVPEEEQSRLQ